MICVASSKHRSMRLARMWNSRSPAWRPRGACRRGSRGTGAAPPAAASPNSRSQASDPIPMTQDRFASRSRNPTARTSAGEVAAERPHGRAIVGAWIYRHDQEDRGAGERCRYGLRRDPDAAGRFRSARGIALHRLASTMIHGISSVEVRHSQPAIACGQRPCSRAPMLPSTWGAVKTWRLHPHRPTAPAPSHTGCPLSLHYPDEVPIW